VDGLDPGGVAELLAEGRDVYVEGFGGPVPVRVPDLVHDLLPADDGPEVRTQQGEEVELLGCEGDLAPGDGDPSGSPVDLEVPTRWAASGSGPALLRRATARTRAMSSRVPNGLTM